MNDAIKTVKLETCYKFFYACHIFQISAMRKVYSLFKFYKIDKKCIVSDFIDSTIFSF